MSNKKRTFKSKGYMFVIENILQSGNPDQVEVFYGTLSFHILLQGVSSHGKPGKVMEFHFFSRPGKVMEIDSRFWKIHKKSWKLKGLLSQNSVVPFFHPVFQYKDMFV